MQNLVHSLNFPYLIAMPHKDFIFQIQLLAFLPSVPLLVLLWNLTVFLFLRHHLEIQPLKSNHDCLVHNGPIISNKSFQDETFYFLQ